MALYGSCQKIILAETTKKFSLATLIYLPILIKNQKQQCLLWSEYTPIKTNFCLLVTYQNIAQR